MSYFRRVTWFCYDRSETCCFQWPLGHQFQRKSGQRAQTCASAELVGRGGGSRGGPRREAAGAEPVRDLAAAPDYESAGLLATALRIAHGLWNTAARRRG